MLDEQIQEHLSEWDYDSIGKVEKSILRLGAFEILVQKTDKAIIINEAVELAKELADEKSPKFINGVLDALESKDS
jgi:N utilization substance protein B